MNNKSRKLVEADKSCKIVGYVLVVCAIMGVLSIMGFVVYEIHMKNIKECTAITDALLSTKLHNSDEAENLIESIEDSEPNAKIKYNYYLGEVTFEVTTKRQSFVVKTNYVDENNKPITN